jgi:hypothetical protein
MATAGVASSDRVRAIKNTPRAGWVQGGRDETARLVDGMGARRWRRLVVVVVVVGQNPKWDGDVPFLAFLSKA